MATWRQKRLIVEFCSAHRPNRNWRWTKLQDSRYGSDTTTWCGWYAKCNVLPGAIQFALPSFTFVLGLITKGFIDDRYAKSLETLKSSLRARESDAAAVRDQIDKVREALVGRSSTRTLALEQRRIDAAERLWDAFVALAPFRALEGVAQSVDIDAVLEISGAGDSQSAGAQEFAKAMLKLSDGAQQYLDDKKSAEANKLEIFVDGKSWEIFSLYRSIVSQIFLRLTFASFGNKIDLLKKTDHLCERAKYVLPEYVDYIEKWQGSGLYFLLDILEKRLIESLRASFGEKVDSDMLALNAIDEALSRAKIPPIPANFKSHAKPPS